MRKGSPAVQDAEKHQSEISPFSGTSHRSHLHTIAFTIYITCLFWNSLYGAYYICPGLIFQYEFNGNVYFVIGLPYLIII